MGQLIRNIFFFSRLQENPENGLIFSRRDELFFDRDDCFPQRVSESACALAATNFMPPLIVLRREGMNCKLRGKVFGD